MLLNYINIPNFLQRFAFAENREYPSMRRPIEGQNDWQPPHHLALEAPKKLATRRQLLSTA